MNKLISLTLTALILFPYQAICAANKKPQPQTIQEYLKDTKIKGKFSFVGSTIDGNINTARILSTKASLEIQHSFFPELVFNFDGGLTLEAGTYDRNAAAGEGPKPSNRLSLQESSLNFTPYSPIVLEAGAINQRRFDSPLLLSSTPFLGVIENVVLSVENISLSLFAEQAYASNKDLASTLPDSGGNQVLPKFYSEGAKLNINYQGVVFDLIGMHWAYNNLGAGIATESAFRGNTINTDNIAGATGLKYKFIGISGATRLEIPFILNSTIKAQAEYLLNQKAPSRKNYGQSAKLGLKFPTWGSSMEIAGQYIKIMPDASAAFYSSYENNREIFEVSATWKNGSSPLEIKFSGAHLEEVIANPYMSPENRISLGLKTEAQFF